MRAQAPGRHTPAGSGGPAGCAAALVPGSARHHGCTMNLQATHHVLPTQMSVLLPPRLTTPHPNCGTV
eukprot:3351169-Alexandrium_andersonii.AAC.1